MSGHDILIGLGFVAVIEGLVLALAPSLYQDVARALSEMPPDTRRTLGLGIVAIGVVLIWLA